MFSKSCQYAIRAVLYLATEAGNQKKGVKEISDALEIPGPFLAKIMQQLSKQHLISSTKGPSGGFYLNEENLQSPMIKVVRSIDGEDFFSSCVLGLPYCSSTHPCPLHEKASEYRNGLLQLLAGQSIRSLAERIKVEDIRI